MTTFHEEEIKVTTKQTQLISQLAQLNKNILRIGPLITQIKQNPSAEETDILFSELQKKISNSEDMVSVLERDTAEGVSDSKVLTTSVITQMVKYSELLRETTYKELKDFLFPQSSYTFSTPPEDIKNKADVTKLSLSEHIGHYYSCLELPNDELRVNYLEILAKQFYKPIPDNIQMTQLEIMIENISRFRSLVKDIYSSLGPIKSDEKFADFCAEVMETGEETIEAYLAELVQLRLHDLMENSEKKEFNPHKILTIINELDKEESEEELPIGFTDSDFFEPKTFLEAAKKASSSQRLAGLILNFITYYHNQDQYQYGFEHYPQNQFYLKLKDRLLKELAAGYDVTPHITHILDLKRIFASFTAYFEFKNQFSNIHDHITNLLSAMKKKPVTDELLLKLKDALRDMSLFKDQLQQKIGVPGSNALRKVLNTLQESEAAIHTQLRAWFYPNPKYSTSPVVVIKEDAKHKTDLNYFSVQSSFKHYLSCLELNNAQECAQYLQKIVDHYNTLKCPESLTLAEKIKWCAEMVESMEQLNRLIADILLTDQNSDDSEYDALLAEIRMIRFDFYYQKIEMIQLKISDLMENVETEKDSKSYKVLEIIRSAYRIVQPEWSPRLNTKPKTGTEDPDRVLLKEVEESTTPGARVQAVKSILEKKPPTEFTKTFTQQFAQELNCSPVEVRGWLKDYLSTMKKVEEKARPVKEVTRTEFRLS